MDAERPPSGRVMRPALHGADPRFATLFPARRREVVAGTNAAPCV